MVKSGAKHDAVVLPLLQLQCHGPLPLTTEAVPVLQRLVVGALLIATPFDVPHKSLTGGGGRGDDVVEPPERGGHLNHYRETETATSIVEFPGTLLAAPDTIREKKSCP